MLAFSNETSVGKLEKMLQILTRNVFVSDTIFSLFLLFVCCCVSRQVAFWRVLFSALFLHC